MCPGNRIILTCQQSGSVTSWEIDLQPTPRLQLASGDTPVGSVITSEFDPDFNFELHIVSRSSSSAITTELQVTAVRELDGVPVRCVGRSGSYGSTIEVASIGELVIIIVILSLIPWNVVNFNADPPAAPSGVMAINKQFTKTGASVNITWSNSTGGADNYTVNVTPPIMSGPGQLSDFTTTDTSLLLMIDYNVNYTINITAQNCAGSNSTVLPITIGKIMIVTYQRLIKLMNQ